MGTSLPHGPLLPGSSTVPSIVARTPGGRAVGSGHKDVRRRRRGRAEGDRPAWGCPGPVPLRESLRETPSLPQPVSTFYKAPPPSKPSIPGAVLRCCHGNGATWEARQAGWLLMVLWGPPGSQSRVPASTPFSEQRDGPPPWLTSPQTQAQGPDPG